MFEQKEEITAAVSSLIAITKPLSKGDTISVHSVENATGISYSENKNRFVYVIRRWARWMVKNRNIEVVWKKGEGFRLCTDEDCATWVPASRRSKAFRQHGRAIRAYKTVDLTKLSPNLAVIASAGIDFSKRQRSELRKLKKAIDASSCDRMPRVSFASNGR